MRHKLTNESVADLLELLRLHCPTPNYCIPSMYHFKKQFCSLAHPIQFHYFCSNCLQSIDELLRVCSNPLCNSDLTEVGARSPFIETDIESQVQVFFECKCTHSRIMFPKVNAVLFAGITAGKGFCTALYDNISSKYSSQGLVGDICDGGVYQELVSQGYFSVQTNISVTFNTDGIPVFRSSGFSFGPSTCV